MSVNNTKDLTGRRFGWLVAVAPTEKRQGGHVVWRCACACGKETLAGSGALAAGRAKSCGCRGILRARARWETMSEETKKIIRRSS